MSHQYDDTPPNTLKKSKKARKRLAKDIFSSIRTKRKATNLLHQLEDSTAVQNFKTKQPAKNKFSKHLKMQNTREETQLNSDPVAPVVDLSSTDSEHSDVENNSNIAKSPVTSPVNESETMESEDEVTVLDSAESQESDSEQSEPEYHQAKNVYPAMKQFDEWIYYRKLDANSILVSINPLSYLYFSGKCTIKILKGEIEIYGYNMTPKDSKRYVFSPKGHSSLIYIKGVARNSKYDDDKEDENFTSDLALTKDEIKDLPGAVIILRSFDNTWAEGFRNICPNGESLVGPKVTGLLRSSTKLPKMKNFMEKLGFQFIPQFMLGKNRLFSTSDAWEKAFTEINSGSDHPRVCIFGGKGVGKSTFTRWMVNKFLGSGKQRVAYLDLDPGQTEFTPPGVLSVSICKDPILGPNFTHLVLQPERCVFLGGVNVSDYPVTYLKAVIQIFEFLSTNEDYTNIPWVINTMGFCQGLGVHLAVSTIKILQPTNVIQITIKNERRSFPFDLTMNKVKNSKASFLERNLPEKYVDISEGYKYFKVESVCDREETTNNNPWGCSPKILRDNVMLSYFAELIGATNDLTFKSVIPYSLSLDKIAIGTMNTNLAFEGIIRAVIGNLIALCHVNQNQSLDSADTDSTSSSVVHQQRVIGNAETLENQFFGYGVVRAYDKTNNTLYVVSPVDQFVLNNNVNAIIAAGDVGLPIQFYGEIGGPARYVMGNGNGGSKLHRPSKKYFVPKKRVTHSVLRNSLL